MRSASRFRLPREQLAFVQGEACLRRTPQARLAHEASSWVAPTLSREGWPDLVCAFHDGEELGPRMLARIAKHTGLQPEDL